MSAEIGRRYRVVAGIDLSPSNVAIARRAALEARLREVPLVLVHALRVPPRAVGASRTPSPSPELLISSAQWLESIAEPLRSEPHSLQVSTRVIPGRADDVLIAESLTATLVVVGEDQCGVVAAEVNHRGCSPVLVVRPDPMPLVTTIQLRR
ncbi:universal stress protein [Kineosporia succinea]|uniref:Nucleotide-binding universal stress UspA family protein n=1 Tax=Kineosporia succinea TaxID=84632 RepID=A0ABT9PEI8_9ACTN|nr:universal stress protein [Kineosporia succinea]MDP9830580.1 nucleotide-binding universal stress UspA family protein [Kineosporia succinea]